ncbi:MAG TPA: M20 family metallopeptidase [Bacillota bacterium]
MPTLIKTANDDLAALKELACRAVDETRATLAELAMAIHAHPELGFEERRAVGLITRILEANGFKVSREAAGLETAFVAEAAAEGGGGDGAGAVSDRAGRTVGILAEYDALPEMGHACGHNLIAASAVGAGLAVRRALEAGKVTGTVKVFGTPAEEGGGGKVLMAGAGLFDGLTAALAMHPSQQNAVGGSCLAVRPFTFRFRGRPAHAAASPHDGINALDAVIATFNGVNALRQQVKPDVRIHGIITKGGTAPNIIPELAEARFAVRAAKVDYLAEVAEKVVNCARAGALATGATLEVKQGLEYADILPCPPLSDLMRANMERLGLTVRDLTGTVTPASSDLGNVSHVVPMEEGNFALVPPEVAYHTEAFCRAAGSAAAADVVVAAAKAIAMTALDLLVSDDAAERVREGYTVAKG